MLRTLSLAVMTGLLSAQPVQTVNPILFVTQTPAAGFTTVTQTFSNHVPSMDNAPRGGDLMIRYGDGTLRNLTCEAGYGDSSVMQGASSIAVRQPCVHWNGTKALFSMVVGAPTKAWESKEFRWQLYEVTGLGKGETAVVTKVPNQPAQYNNLSPVYGSDGRIIFTSDLPVTKQPHHYPQLDEYENARVVTGLWSLDPAAGDLRLLQHSPSGSFYPTVDSYGRVIFTRWDHLQRDQQADLDRAGQPYGTFNYSSEHADGVPLNDRTEVFPEPRSKLNPDHDSTMSLHTFNHFFPWEINQDGTEEETVNHVGRHEFGGSYSDRSFLLDGNLSYLIPKENIIKNRAYLTSDAGLFHLREDPKNPGVYFAANAREFSRESAGQLMRFTGAKGMNPEEMELIRLTHPVTAGSTEEGKTPDPNHSGHYRTPLPMSDGQLIVSHTASTFANKNEGSGEFPKVRYAFRLRTVKSAVIGGVSYLVADQALTPGIVRTLHYYNGNDYVVQRTDTLWELDPVEVASRPVPPLKYETPLAAPEAQAFADENVDPAAFRTWMKQNGLALAVSRNVTTRDRTDNMQPFNLSVPGGVQSVPTGGTVYEVKYLQMFQADHIRGQGGAGGHTTPRPGRRVLPQPMHDAAVKNPPNQTGPAGSVKLGPDGSMASLVPAHRAMTWQLTDGSGKGIVRERYWISFQPGEIRTCASCHGVNAKDQTGAPKPQNTPEALRTLLKYWKAELMSVRGDAAPAVFALEQNHPNPFNPETDIVFQLPQDGAVTLTVHDMLGRQVAVLADGVRSAGRHRVRFDAAGRSSGIYFYTLRARGRTETKRMLLLR